MANPALNDKTFLKERVQVIDPYGRPVPATGRRTTMSLDGVVQKTALLLGLLVAAGAVGWSQVDRTSGSFPLWVLPALFVALGLAVATIFAPRIAHITAPLYAVVEGVVVGAVSAAYEAQFSGIVVQAVLLTVGIAVALLALFATGRIRVTQKFRLIVIAATFAVMATYLVDLVAHLFGSSIPFIHDSGPLGILFSGVVIVIASLNLILDFDFIQRGIEAGTARHMEWYAGFAVLVHLVWLYLEVLRLLSRLQRR